MVSPHADQEPTGLAAEADGSIRPDDQAPPPARRRRRRWLWLTGAVALVAALVASSMLIKLDYYRFAPGTLYVTEPLVSTDAQTYRDDGGEISFTTVSIKRASLLDALVAWPDSASELVDRELVDGTGTPEDTRRQNLAMMADAKQVSEYVALQKLGYPVSITGEGALVQEVGDGSPAAGKLHVDDTVTAVGDTPVTTAVELVDAVRALPPGTTVTLTVVGPPGADDAGHADDVSSRTRTEEVTLAARPDDPEAAYLGVSPGTRAGRLVLPVDISIDSVDVWVPSAGLAFTLAIMDLLTPGSLTGGARVAATGTVDLNGNVGPVGGVQQKGALASREDVDLLLVPAEEYDEIVPWADGVKVVPVHNVDDALAALHDLGGDTEVVEQVAAGAPGGG